MAQDFAKRKPGTASKKAPARKSQAQRHPGEAPSRGKSLRLYLSGVLTGMFLSFLLYLGTLQPPAEPGLEVASAPSPEAVPEIPKPVFEFYNILQKPSMEGAPDAVEPDVIEPAADLPKPAVAAAQEPYFLQAGSFRQRGDAESRRAELVLLGLSPKIEESSGDNGHWFRVSVGPFDSHESTARARSLLMKQNIEYVLLRRSGP